MISNKYYQALDGTTKSFLSEFVIRSEQYCRVYNFVYDPEGVDGEVDPTTGLFVRVNNLPTQNDIVGQAKWALINGSISFYTAPPQGSTLVLEVATTTEELGEALAGPAVIRSEAAAASAEAFRDQAEGYATAADASADEANTKFEQAEAQATLASGYATAANTAVGEAEGAENKAKLWANEDYSVTVEGTDYSAKHWSEQSRLWAEKPYGQEVETGQYSAKHWAEQAAIAVAEGIIDDTTVDLNYTWSSNKLQNELDAKVDVTSLGANVNLYVTDTVGDFGYYRLVSTLDDPDYDDPAVDVTLGPVTGADIYLGGFIADPGIFVGTVGNFSVPTVGNIKRISGDGTARFYFELYHRANDGTETLIGTSTTTVDVSSSEYIQLYDVALFQATEFTNSCRLVVKYYGTKVNGGTDPSYQIQVGGDSPIRTTLTIPAANVAVLGADKDYELLTEVGQNFLGKEYPVSLYTNNIEVGVTSQLVPDTEHYVLEFDSVTSELDKYIEEDTTLGAGNHLAFDSLNVLNGNVTLTVDGNLQVVGRTLNII